MTQSGQGEQPSARPAREGIVLPSDGGEPLLPGMSGTSGGGRPGGPAPAPPPTTTPAGGQSWGTPWGPEQQTPQPAPGWTPPPAQPWGTPDGAQQQPASWGGQDAGALPQGGPDAYGAAPHVQQQHQQHQDSGAYGHGGAAPLPPAQHAGPGHALPPADGGVYGHQGAAPLPPADGGVYGHQGAAPLPPAGAPQPPAAGVHPDQATHYLPPVAANAPNEGATQYIPPVGPGALPPEMPAGPPAESPAEATQFLGRAQQPGGQHADHAAQQAHGGPQPGTGPLPPASGPDAEATQFMAPVTGQHPGAAYGERQPPAEFDNLFRSEPGESPAGATQQMPRFQQPAPPQAAAPAGYAPQGPGGGRHDNGYGGQGGDGGRGGRGGRGRSRVPLIAAIGVAIAVVGIGAGALLAGGGGGEDDDKQPVSATGPTAEESASPSADPAKAQAVELDKLLADSGDSRTTVISAVADVKACRNLDGAAKDLRDAAKQRTGLVTRLSGVAVDKLPGHAELTSALTKAWQASASADNHYAAWADQVAAKKPKCKKGQAPSTGRTAAGNRESGTASQQKTKAAELWNAVARTYGLTERRPTQL